MIEAWRIKDIVKKIVEGFKPERIILFGSYASGNPDEDSDLDLLIIKESNQPRYRRSIEIRKSLIGSNIPMDILVYTTEEFEQEKDEKYSFINEAIRSSIILYERVN